MVNSQESSATLATYGVAIAWVGNRINKGIYGLPKAGRLAKEKLIALLARSGYKMTDNNECLFRHDTRDNSFALIMNDFAINFKHREGVEHLLAAIEQEDSIEAD